MVDRGLKFEITVENPATGLPEKIAGAFSAEEHRILNDYLRYVDEFTEMKFLKSNSRGSSSISQQKGQPVEFNVIAPEKEQFDAFLHRIRPFIHNGEPTCFYRVAKLIGRETHSSWFMKNLLGELRDTFNADKNQNGTQILSNGEVLNSEKSLDAYLYGFEYHRHTHNEEYIAELHRVFPLDATRVIFAGMLLEKTRAILLLADLVAVTIGKEKNAVDFTIRLPKTDK